MSTPSPDPIDEAKDADGWERALLDRQLERLDRLAEMGMAIAGAIQQRATAGPDAALDHAAIDFSRVSRAVRMTLALQSRLVRDFKTPPKAASAQDEEEPYDGPFRVMWLGQEEQEAEQRRRVQNTVRGLAEDAALDSETVERLTAEAGERLERDDIYDDILTRPFDELVAMICKDLGLASPVPLDGGEAGSGDDGSAAARPAGCPHPQPFPDQGGRDFETSLHPPFNGSS